VRRFVAVAAAFLFGALILRAASVLAVSEEPIGASSSVNSKARTAEPDVRPDTEPNTETAPEEAAPMPAPEEPGPPRAPHATFPYNVREGDTLGSIANQFGLSVADLTRLNHITEETELDVGRILRVPNPAVARERDLTAEIERLQRAAQDAASQAQTSQNQLATARARATDLTAANDQAIHDLRSLPWWHGAAYVFGGLAILALAAMLLALVEWWLLRSRFRAVAEMNESLRRLDHRYRIALAKAELRLQELYGRRRRGIHDGQDRPKLAEEAEIEMLHRELKTVLERHLERLGPAGVGARRARWRERIAGIGSPVAARTLRR
jgi:LysM repeat protein